MPDAQTARLSFTLGQQEEKDHVEDRAEES